MWMQFPLEHEFIHLITEHTLLFGIGGLIQIIFLIAAVIFWLSSRKTSKRYLAQAHYFNLIFSTAPFEIVHLDQNGLIKKINEAGAKSLGYRVDELLQKSFITTFVCAVDVPKLERMLADCNEDRTKDCMARVSITKKGGEKAVLACYLTPFWTDEDLDGFMLFARDITIERKVAHWQEQGRRLEAVQLFAHGIIHDFNNVFQIILGKAELASMDVQIGSFVRVESALQEIMKQGRQAIRMISTLWELTKERSDRTYPIPFKGLITDVCASEIINSSYNIQIPPDLWAVWGDIEAIRQMLVQLCQNADQAIPTSRQGEIVISFENVQSKDIPGWVLTHGRYVRIRINDNGIGIPAEFLDRVFDPYVTTKMRGSGLGLAMVQAIVKKHQGHVVIESEMGVGTTFNIYLPAVTFTCEGNDEPIGKCAEKAGG